MTDFHKSTQPDQTDPKLGLSGHNHFILSREFPQGANDSVFQHLQAKS